VGVGLLVPASAVAAPTITILSPENGKTYQKGSVVNALYSCSDAPVECSATQDATGTAVASGAAVDTSTVGQHYITVTAKDATTSTQQQAVYFVDEAPPGIPATLDLTLGNLGAFAPFVPGIANNYTTTATATILSTAADGVLSVADGSSTGTGYLLNAGVALASPLQVAGTRPAGENQPAPTPVYAPVGGNANPTTLITYNGPINEADTIHFRQPITGTESLRTGAYSKTLTFTLSTTTP
jgi:hypothetical protein